MDTNSVDYARLVAELIEAVKEQQKIIDEQNARLTKIESILEKLNMKKGR